MSCFKLILGILLTLMGSPHSSSADGDRIGILLKAQGLKLFEELTADKSDGILRMVWLRGEQGTIILDCDLSKRTLEKTVLLKSNAAKEKRVLSESDKAVLKFIVDRFEFEKVPAEDPYEGGLDGDSIYVELHFLGAHRHFSRWKPFESYKLPVSAGQEPDPFAASSKPTPQFQLKSAEEQQLTSLAVFLLHMSDSGMLLPSK